VLIGHPLHRLAHDRRFAGASVTDQADHCVPGDAVDRFEPQHQGLDRLVLPVSEVALQVGVPRITGEDRAIQSTSGPVGSSSLVAGVAASRSPVGIVATRIVKSAQRAQ
jgi:hypothetical protein